MPFIEIIIKEIIQEAGAGSSYKMIFEDLDGTFMLPIVISSYDAQPLMALLDGDSSRRPRTHELFCRFITASGYRMEGFRIMDFIQGVFHTTASFYDGDRRIELDCRPTDAVCIALQCGAKMYIARDIVDKIAMMLTKGGGGEASVKRRIDALQERLERLVKDERYEEAAKVRDKIEELKNGME